MSDVLAATAARFLDDACEELGLSAGVHEWLRASERELTVKVSITGADSDVRVFTGHRVQHSSVRGPYKGGLRLDDAVTLEETRALAQLMTVKTGWPTCPSAGPRAAWPARPRSSTTLSGRRSRAATPVSCTARWAPTAT